jgi:DNA-binding MurR/RpiR family transcriptional regulator
MKLYQSKEFLNRRYVLQKKTIKEIADECGVSHMTIQRYLEQFGLIKNQRKWTK